ncbi:hypothetical protein ACFLZP_03235 [Patescibacteria group bacterium]
MQKHRPRQLRVKKHPHSFLHYLAVIFLNLPKKVALFVLFFHFVFWGQIVFQTAHSPANFLFGLPLFLIGGSMGLIRLWEIIHLFAGPRYNQSQCPFCSAEGEPNKILFPKKERKSLLSKKGFQFCRSAS